jgi:hypothetical protein
MNDDTTELRVFTELKYAPATVAHAANIVPRTVTNWASLGKITLHRERPGTGRARSYSLAQLVEVALAAEIQRRLGLRSVEDAFAVARVFSRHDPLAAYQGGNRHLLIYSAESAEVRVAEGPAWPLHDLPPAAIIVEVFPLLSAIFARLEKRVCA